MASSLTMPMAWSEARKHTSFYGKSLNLGTTLAWLALSLVDFSASKPAFFSGDSVAKRHLEVPIFNKMHWNGIE